MLRASLVVVARSPSNELSEFIRTMFNDRQKRVYCASGEIGDLTRVGFAARVLGSKINQNRLFPYTLHTILCPITELEMWLRNAFESNE